MELTSQGTDNPEQRIEQDCDNFATQTLSLALGLLLQIMTLVTFAVVLWNLSGGFVLPIFGGVAIPGYMMWAALLYALVGSLATYFIGRPLVRINFLLERYNADFRYRMVRIRENAESIALYRGEADEERSLRGAFARIYGTWWELMKYTKRLTWLTAFYGQAAPIFPIIVAAPQYFAGQIPLGVLTQTADAFAQVQRRCPGSSTPIRRLAAWKAGVDRLTTFGEAMVKAKAAAARNRVRGRAQPQPRELALEDVEVRLPNGAPLLEDVDVDRAPGRIRVARAVRRAAARPRCSACSPACGRSAAGRIGAAEGRAHAVPAAEALSADRHAEGGAVLSRDARALTPTRHAARCWRPAGWGISRPASTRPPTGRWCCRAASSSASPSRARCSTGRTGCSSTRRPRRWTRPPSGACTSCCAERLPAATVISVAHRPAVAAFHDRQLVIDPASRRVRSEPVTA